MFCQHLDVFEREGLEQEQKSEISLQNRRENICGSHERIWKQVSGVEKKKRRRTIEVSGEMKKTMCPAPLPVLANPRPSVKLLALPVGVDSSVDAGEGQSFTCDLLGGNGNTACVTETEE